MLTYDICIYEVETISFTHPHALFSLVNLVDAKRSYIGTGMRQDGYIYIQSEYCIKKMLVSIDWKQKSYACSFFGKINKKVYDWSTRFSPRGREFSEPSQAHRVKASRVCALASCKKNGSSVWLYMLLEPLFCFEEIPNVCIPWGTERTVLFYSSAATWHSHQKGLALQREPLLSCLQPSCWIYQSAPCRIQTFLSTHSQL